MKRNIVIVTSLILIILVFSLLVKLEKKNNNELENVRLADATLTSRTYIILFNKHILR